MLFYASLFIVSFVSACVLIWMFRSLKEVGTDLYRAFLPSHKGNVKVERTVNLRGRLESMPTPWGWHSSNRHVKTMPQIRREPAVSGPPAPWGWRGHEKNSSASKPGRLGNAYADKAYNSQLFERVRNTVGISNPSESSKNVRVGWPYREESFDFAGSSITYSSKPKTSKTHASKTAKPWGW